MGNIVRQSRSSGEGRRPDRRVLLAAAIGSLVPRSAGSAQLPTGASARLNEGGPEAAILAGRVGLWDVEETTWSDAGAAPSTTTGLVAERFLVGTLLQEFMRPPADAPHPDVKRTDLLSYNRLEGRWQYVSFDARVPVGLMTAWSRARGDGSTIDLTFYPFAFPGTGEAVGGQMLRMDQVISFDGPDRDVKDQHFALADGTGSSWLAHRYSYRRRV